MKYLIVLFKNKERKKIIKKFKTYDRAKKYYDNLILRSDNVLFDKQIENGLSAKFELGLVDSSPENFEAYYIKDELGRQIKVNVGDGDYKILTINNYRTEELVFDLQRNKRITMIDVIRRYLPREGVKVVSKLNNKVIIQNDDNVFLLSTKSDDDCFRFLTTLSQYMLKNKRFDSLIVTDDSSPQKKYLYGLLTAKGISKSFLYRNSTTYFLKK